MCCGQDGHEFYKINKFRVCKWCGMEKKLDCPRCGNLMDNIQVCHQRCPKCGAELTCSDEW